MEIWEEALRVGLYFGIVTGLAIGAWTGRSLTTGILIIVAVVFLGFCVRRLFLATFPTLPPRSR